MGKLNVFSRSLKKFIIKLILFLEKINFLKIPTRTLPDFLIIGGMRCGTTSLFRYLNNHPSIYCSIIKEIRYFDVFFHKGLFWYRSFFPLIIKKFYNKYIKKKDFITGEATPEYFIHPNAPKRIYSKIPNVKLIILLRNPVERAYSDYNYVRERDRIKNRVRRQKLTFKQAIERGYYKEKGTYIKHIKRWFKYFPKNQFLIIKSEVFFKNSNSILKKVHEFLGLPFFKLNNLRKYNKVKYEEMSTEIRKKLIDYFEPFNQQLYEFLGVNFNWESKNLKNF